MAQLSNPVPIQVEYNPKKRRISLNRIFQIPQMFRPAASIFFANTLGLVSWTLAVGNVKAQAYRDTRGPGLDAYKALLAVARAQPGAKGLRDVALLRLLHDLGLRRGEAVRLAACRT